MSKIKYLSMVALAVTTVAAPAMAREKAVAQQATQSAYADVDGRVCVAAPRVGAFATQPWTNGNVPCEP